MRPNRKNCGGPGGCRKSARSPHECWACAVWSRICSPVRSPVLLSVERGDDLIRQNKAMSDSHCSPSDPVDHGTPVQPPATGLLSPLWDRFVACPHCGHQRKLDATFFDVANVRLGRQFVGDDLLGVLCSKCGSRGAELIPPRAEAPMVKRSRRPQPSKQDIPDAHEDWWSRDRD